MKIVLIADPHVLPPGGMLRTIDTAKRLEAAVSKVNELAADADLCVVLGDSVNEPTVDAYETFLDRLARLRMPIRSSSAIMTTGSCS